MAVGGYKITDQGAMYFVSFTIVGWVDVFTRKDHRDVPVILRSLQANNLRKALLNIQTKAEKSGWLKS